MLALYCKWVVQNVNNLINNEHFLKVMHIWIKSNHSFNIHVVMWNTVELLWILSYPDLIWSSKSDSLFLKNNFMSSDSKGNYLINDKIKMTKIDFVTVDRVTGWFHDRFDKQYNPKRYTPIPSYGLNEWHLLVFCITRYLFRIKLYAVYIKSGST